jgi:hypothetical protein
LKEGKIMEKILTPEGFKSESKTLEDRYKKEYEDFKLRFKTNPNSSILYSEQQYCLTKKIKSRNFTDMSSPKNIIKVMEEIITKVEEIEEPYKEGAYYNLMSAEDYTAEDYCGYEAFIEFRYTIVNPDNPYKSLVKADIQPRFAKALHTYATENNMLESRQSVIVPDCKIFNLWLEGLLNLDELISITYEECEV